MFGNAYAGKRTFVTGHTGFKGAWLTEWLLTLGADVAGYSLPAPTEPALFDQLGLRQRVHHHEADIRDRESLLQAVQESQPDFVFHLAAQAIVRESYATPVETFATNLMGTAHVLEALRNLDRPCAAVLVTTDKCYENRDWIYGYREDDSLGGFDPYSASKAAAEIAIASWRRSFFTDHPVRIASARAGNVIGGGDWAKDRIVPDCIRALQAGQPVAVRNPQATRPWQHVLEPLSGYLWLAALLYSQRSEIRSRRSEVGDQRSESAGLKPALTSDLRPPTSEVCPLSSVLCSAFNFGPGHDANRTVAELVEEVLKSWPGRWEDQSDPRAVHEAGLLQLSIDKAHALLRWAPAWSLAEAVEETVAWYKQAREKATVESLRDLTLRQIQHYSAKARELNLPWAVSDNF